jgi:signal transduction histidine kinase
VVRWARPATLSGRPGLRLNLNVSGGFILVYMLDHSGIDVDALVDSTVTIRGACSTKFNERRQIIGLVLIAPGAASLKVDTPAPDPLQIPRTAIEQMQRYLPGLDTRHRLEMTGTLTYQSPEHGLYLEDKGEAIHVETAQREAFHLGDRLEALGFVHTFGYSSELQDAQIKKLGAGREVEPVRVEPSNVIKIENQIRSTAYDGRLVQMTATVVEQMPNGRHPLWLLRRGDTLFQAELRGDFLPGMADFEPQSTVNVVGICVAEVDDDGQATSFRLLLRSAADITIAHSPYWKDSFLVLLAGMLFLLAAGALLWTFEYRYAPANLKKVTPETAQALVRRFEFASAALSWSALGLAALNLPLAVWGTANQENSTGSWITRLALAAAAWAVCWHRSRSGWKSWSSVACSLCIAGGGAFALLQYQSAPGAFASLRAAEFLGGAGITVAIAFCCCLFGVSLLLLRSERFSAVGQLLSLCVAAAGALNLLTLLYNASGLYGVARHTAMPLAVAVRFSILGLAALFSQPASGLMKTISAPSLGGLISRRLLPAALIIPVFLGWLRVQGQSLGLYDTLYGMVLLALSNLLFFGCLIWASAVALNRLDTARSQGERALFEANNSLELRVTERTAKLAETNKELARKNEEVEAFVYAVSHDLRTPLVNLQGFCKELELSCQELREKLLAPRHVRSSTEDEERIQTILTSDIPDSLRYISASTTKFQRLINALLALSRYGRQEYHSEELDLGAVVQSTLDLLHLSIATSGIKVSVAPIPKVYGDVTALGQVFANLIGNAIKYLQPDRPGFIEIGGESEDGNAHCWVRDNGVGLPASAKSRLFQVFQRFHPDHAEGEGMGLAIVRRIVERHGGKIWAEGEEGVGTTFHFTLPGGRATRG